MAKSNDLEKMSYNDLVALHNQIQKSMAEKQAAERLALREQMSEMAKAHGLSLEEVMGKGGGRKGSVPVKYRDPKNPGNTWSGRGRSPRWLTAAMKGGRAKKEDFLVK